MTLTVQVESAKYFSMTFVVDVKIRLNEKKRNPKSTGLFSPGTALGGGFYPPL